MSLFTGEEGKVEIKVILTGSKDEGEFMARRRVLGIFRTIYDLILDMEDVREIPVKVGLKAFKALYELAELYELKYNDPEHIEKMKKEKEEGNEQVVWPDEYEREIVCKTYFKNYEETKKNKDVVPDCDDDFLTELILAANLLDAKRLLDVYCMTVAELVKGQSPEELRKVLERTDKPIPEDLDSNNGLTALSDKKLDLDAKSFNQLEDDKKRKSDS
jgi:hypothetical protein